jgi:hypothetical protein
VISEFGFFGAGSQVATILYIVKKRTNLSSKVTLSNSVFLRNAKSEDDDHQAANVK